MANTKLSNIDGLEEMIKNVPGKIDKYTEEVHEEVDEIKAKSLYYSEMSVMGMITCIALLIIGVGSVFVPNLLFGLLHISRKMMLVNSNIVVRVAGIFLILISIHEISRMLFAARAEIANKRVYKLRDAFRNQFESMAIPKVTGDYLFKKIDNFEDEEIEESSLLDDKLFNSVSSVQSGNERFTRLVRISRIVLPGILFALVVLAVIIKGTGLGLDRVILSFIIMFIFNDRLCLLLEYRVGNLIRAVMCVPSVVYGLILFASIKEETKKLNFLSYFTPLKFPKPSHSPVSTTMFVCLIQVIVLILAVAFKDYYSEKMYWRDGAPQKSNGEEKDKKWSIIYKIIIYSIMTAVYVNILVMEMVKIQHINSAVTAILYGAILGAVWRVISPVWPEKISKTIRRFWGVKYTIVVELFVVALILSAFLLRGFVFTPYSNILFVSAILFSWIAFAVMNHFWG